MYVIAMLVEVRTMVLVLRETLLNERWVNSTDGQHDTERSNIGPTVFQLWTTLSALLTSEKDDGEKQNRERGRRST